MGQRSVGLANRPQNLTSDLFRVFVANNRLANRNPRSPRLNRLPRIGSSFSKGLGRPVSIAQNEHRRVHRSPIIIKVAVPFDQHSPKFGQCALSQTVTKFSDLTAAVVCAKSSPLAIGRLSHSGSRRTDSVFVI